MYSWKPFRQALSNLTAELLIAAYYDLNQISLRHSPSFLDLATAIKNIKCTGLFSSGISDHVVPWAESIDGG